MSNNQVHILNYNHNNVNVVPENNIITITDNNLNKPYPSVNIPQPVTKILQINSPGPQGPNSRPYKVYTALLTQYGTNAPTAAVLENTIGTITFGYQSPGNYTVNSSALFTANKTWTNLTNKDNATLPLSMYRNTDSLLFLIDANGDNGLLETSIEIRVYN
jgi:hypothetical protein